MKNVHAVPVNVAVEFLGGVLPFSDLPPEELARVARQCSIDFVPSDVLLMKEGETEVSDLWLVQRGGVKLFLTGEEGGETLVDFRGEGAAVGALALIRGSRANLNVRTVEDTFFFRMKKEAFLSLVETHPGFAQYYLKNFSDAYVSKAFGELRRRGVAPKSEGSLRLFTARVGEVIRREPVTVGGGENIRHAAEIMAREGVGSVLVTDEGGKIRGIVTDKDFRSKVVAQGLNYNWPVREIMAAPVITIDARASCFDALLKMMKRHIHHLAVSEEGRIRGMITSHDILILQGHSPFSLYKEIVAEPSFEGLYELSKRVMLVVRMLVEEGARANNVGRMIAVLNDLVLERLITLTLERMGPPPVGFCWLCLGSEGRKEQTFRTDQDNALIHGDAQNDAQRALAEEYFRELGESVIEHLVACGFPRCKGEMMASNPKWRKSVSGWRGFFRDLIERPEPERVLHATIFFDFRPGFGDAALAETLRREVAQKARRNDVFLRYIAADLLKTRPPLSFFRNFIVEKDGEHRNRLDLKTRGIVPFVDFGRLLALQHGITDTNTMDRLRGAFEAGHLSRELFSEIREAFEFLMQVRLTHQLAMMERGETPDNHVDPARLTELEKQTLKEAFAVVGAMQAYVRDAFRLNI